MVTRTEVAEEARTWVGTKFKKGGRDRTGIDCIGLLVAVGRKYDFDIFDTTEYSFNPEPEKFRNLVYDQTVERKISDMAEGNILLFRQAIFPMHTGILAKDEYGRFTVINASAKERKVVEELLTSWEPLLIGVRDYKEFA